MRVSYYEKVNHIEIQEGDKNTENFIYIFTDNKEHKYILEGDKIYVDFINKEDMRKKDEEIKDLVKKTIEEDKISEKEAKVKVSKMKDWNSLIKKDRYEYKVVLGKNNLIDIANELLEY